MARRHGSTAGQRVAWESQVLGGGGTYGLVTLLSREAGVSRQTLYTWVEQGRAALEQAFAPREAERTSTSEVERQALSRLVETPASVRGIQARLWQVARRRVGQGTISAIIREAQRRAQQWLATHAPASSRPLALDEMYGNDRRGAYLHIVDTASHAVWAAEGPVPVATESWTLVPWLAAGQRPLGRNPRTDLVAHAADCTWARSVANALRFLTSLLRDLLEVVVLTPAGVLDTAGREREVGALLALLDELAVSAPPAQQTELARLHRHSALAVPGLLAVAPPVDRVQQDAAVVLGDDGVALVAWAWQHRAILGPRRDELVAQFPPAWQSAARLLIHAWETAVRASSAVENWHSLLRPHLAVHRVRSPGLLARLVVWHNHRAFARGPHAGVSPLHLSGMTDAPADWLVALGYPPLDAAPIAAAPTTTPLPMAA